MTFHFFKLYLKHTTQRTKKSHNMVKMDKYRNITTQKKDVPNIDYIMYMGLLKISHNLPKILHMFVKREKRMTSTFPLHIQ